MNGGPVAIAVRLSARQVSLIWPGLNFVVMAELTRKHHGQALHTYPFGILILPPGFDSGTYSDQMMSSIDRLWDSLSPRRKRGARLRLDTFGIRAAVLAVRLTLQVRRFQIRTGIEESQKALKVISKDDKARREKIAAELRNLREARRFGLPKLKTRTEKVIQTLERLAKRATRRFLAIHSKQELDNLSREWRAHVRWVRFNLAYFKPFRPVTPDYRRMQWRRIDQLVNMVKQEMKRRRLKIPCERELRRIARAYIRSCKRRGEKDFNFIYMLRNTEDPTAQSRLFEFFEPRIEIERTR